MKPSTITGTLMVMALQAIAFSGLWSLIVKIARSSDRFPPELFIGTTIHYGTLLVITLFIICGVAALIANNPIVKWSAIIAGIFAWLLWLWPAFGSHPLAMPAFFALGSVILVVGTSLGIPLIKRLAARKNYPR